MDEKQRLLNGKNFWSTYENKALGIKEIVFSDGPTGLRFQTDGQDHLGMNGSSPATCFPTSSALSCSWDLSLVEEVASCIAAEAADKGVDVVLAPGVNIKRSPLCGRNFEYYSEDPLLAKEFGKAFVNGLQKNGIGASLKHFAANNQEAYRMSVDTRMDERALHEIYLSAFEGIVKEAGPWTVMSAYNRLFGDYCSENRWLLTELLRESWGFEGLVVSDWYAVNDIVKSIRHGLDLEMPSVGNLSCELLKSALKDGSLSKDAVERAVQKLRELSEKCTNDIKTKLGKPDLDRHHETARRAAAESAVLLKNTGNVLPLKSGVRTLYVGELLRQPVIQGSGSSLVHPVKTDSFEEELQRMGAPFLFEPGYRLNEEAADEELIHSAAAAAAQADKVVIFAGLSGCAEAESYDRTDLNLPACQDILIERLASTGKELVVVLLTGSAVLMPWVGKVSSVLQMGLSGQGCCKALADVLLGKVNPSGKLSETYPLKLAHIPSWLHRGGSKLVEYGESIFTGYRYYDKKELDVLFPFGYGLSYTEFKYDSLKVIQDGNTINVSVVLENTGTVAGSEVVQLYAGLNENSAIQPVRKLAAFKKVRLEPGERSTVEFTLPESTFRYYCPLQKEWVFATGINTIEVGKSSRDIVLKETIRICKNNRKYAEITPLTTIGELLSIPVLREFTEIQINGLAAQSDIGGEAMNPKELEHTLFYMPLRNIIRVTCGAFSPADLKDFIDILNGMLGDTPL